MRLVNDHPFSTLQEATIRPQPDQGRTCLGRGGKVAGRSRQAAQGSIKAGEGQTMNRIDFKDFSDWDRDDHIGDGLAVAATVLITIVGAFWIGLMAINRAQLPEICRNYPTECAAAIEESRP
jgi:hypothetical protein